MRPDPATLSPDIVAAADRRIVALDGFRGLMTIVVVVSHFFAEVKHGIPALMMGWLAVDAFFVLSGYLIGRLILDKAKHDNFFWVFYVRRVCRTFPIYFVCVGIIFAIDAMMHAKTTYDAAVTFPLWSYLTFVQNFFMSASSSIGQHWLSPTWTLAVEEQFYLIAPALVVFTPRRFLMPVLASLICIAMYARIEFSSSAYPLAANVSLVANADLLVAGIMAAVAYKTWKLDWKRHELLVRIIPVVLLVVSLVIYASFGGKHPLTLALVQPMVAAAFAIMILSLVMGAPEAERYESKVLCFFGNISYAVYLTHLLVLGLMHNFILGTAPDIETPAQIAVTIAALPVTTLVSWILTKAVEEPISAYGRSFKWSEKTIQRPAMTDEAPAQTVSQTR